MKGVKGTVGCGLVDWSVCWSVGWYKLVDGMQGKQAMLG